MTPGDDVDERAYDGLHDSALHVRDIVVQRK